MVLPVQLVFKVQPDLQGQMAQLANKVQRAQQETMEQLVLPEQMV